MACACTALALINLAVWLKQRAQYSSLLVTVSALAVAVIAVFEMMLMGAASAREYAVLVRWAQAPVFVLVMAVMAFVRVHFAAGRLWLAYAVFGIKRRVMKTTTRWMSILAGALTAITLAAGCAQMPTSMPAGRNVGIASIPNLRDLGGYRTVDGKTVASGLVYRSNQLSGIPPGDMEKLGSLGLQTAFDLRTAEERNKRPEELPKSVKYVVLDVLADSPQAGPAQLEKLMVDPKLANAELGGGKVEAAFQASYREFVSLPSARREFRNLYLSLGDRAQVPALFHCTTGKDRTGWAAAAFLSLMGVPKDKVYEDYLRSNDYILPAYQKAIDGFVAGGGTAEIPKAILGVKKEYLDAAFDEMQREYGTVERYFAEGLGIDAAHQQALRSMYRQ